jgi:hypothetical protein
MVGSALLAIVCVGQLFALASGAGTSEFSDGALVAAIASFLISWAVLGIAGAIFDIADCALRLSSEAGKENRV